MPCSNMSKKVFVHGLVQLERKVDLGQLIIRLKFGKEKFDKFFQRLNENNIALMKFLRLLTFNR